MCRIDIMLKGSFWKLVTTDWTVAGWNPPSPLSSPFTSLPNYRPYVLWVTLSRCIWCIWCIRWPSYGNVWSRQPSQCIRYSILGFCLPTGTPRWLAIRIHPPDARGDIERSRNYASRKIRPPRLYQNSIIIFLFNKLVNTKIYHILKNLLKFLIFKILG